MPPPLPLPSPVPFAPTHSVLLGEAAARDRSALLHRVHGLCGHRLHALTWLESLGQAPDLLYVRCDCDAVAELDGLLCARLPALRRTLRRYRRLRCGVSDSRRQTGCVVVTRVPIRDAAQAQQRADRAFAALQDGAHALRGLIASHLYLSDDGRALLECTEWHSAEVQRRALQREPERLPLAVDRAASVMRYRPRTLPLAADTQAPLSACA